MCQAAGIIGAAFTLEAIPTWYESLAKPSFAPPNWLFGPAWTLLYFLMAIAFYLVWVKLDHKRAKKPKVKNQNIQIALNLFLAQLLLNFIWSPVFFGAKSPELALVIIVVLWAMILATIKAFFPLSKAAAYLLIPYLLWVSFASVLNAAIAWLN